MSVPPSRAQSEVFSASQYGSRAPSRKPYRINYFIIPVFILEVIGLACLWALFYYLRFTTVFPYHHRVFYCRDPSLMKPNFEPRDFLLWVSPQVLYCVCFILPPFVILVGEIMFWLFSTKPRKTVYANCKECKVHLFTRRLFRFISVFMFGALIVCIFIDTIKLITGYQRPYFLTLCNVNYTSCPPPFEHSPSPSPHRACRNRDNDDDLRFAWLTFPSIYAGLSSFSAIFMSCYVYYMISLRGAPLLRPFLICGFLGMALVASFSRIQGYKNHWRDIWVGWLIGALMAIWLLKQMSDKYIYTAVRPFLICGFLGMALVASFSRIQGYKNHWRNIWVGWLIGALMAIWLCHMVLCFQEVYTIEMEKETRTAAIEERISPFFSWFRLPRVTAPSRKESTYSVYTADESPPAHALRHRAARDNQRTYEVTTTTESFQRTIAPPHHTPNGINY